MGKYSMGGGEGYLVNQDLITYTLEIVFKKIETNSAAWKYVAYSVVWYEWTFHSGL